MWPEPTALILFVYAFSLYTWSFLRLNNYLTKPGAYMCILGSANLKNNNVIQELGEKNSLKLALQWCLEGWHLNA